MFYEKASQNVEIATPVKLDIDVHNDVKPLTVKAGQDENIDGDDVINASGDVDDEYKTIKKEETNEDKARSTTCSGRAISHPARLIKEIKVTVISIGLSEMEEKYYDTMWKSS
jgi:thioredoxin reductase